MWRELVFSGRLPCSLSLVLRLFCFVSFSFFVYFAFTEAAVLRPIVYRSSICMRPDSHIQLALPASFFVFVSLENVVFSEYFRTITVLLERTSYVFFFWMGFSTL